MNNNHKSTTTTIPTAAAAAADCQITQERDGCIFAAATTRSSKSRVRELLRVRSSSRNASACRFSSNHASNYLPLRSVLPRDRPEILEILDRVLEARDERQLKPEVYRGL